MNIVKTASAAVIAGLVMVSAAPIPVRAAVTGSGSANAEVASAADRSPAATVEHSWFMPSAANQRHESMTCRPGHIFSQHDVVGDPESCIMQGASVGGARGTATGVPAL
jgi:hypothetical protein